MKMFIAAILTFSVIEMIAILPKRTVSRSDQTHTAVVTAISTATAKCGATATTRVHGNFTNGRLQEIGVSSVSMSGPIVSNTDLSANPPHTGQGDGEATITQTGVCTVTRDAQGQISVSPSYTSTSSTKACSNGE